MSNRNTKSITDEEVLQLLDETVEEDPQFKQATVAFAEKLAGKLFDRGFSLSGIEERLDTIQETLKDHGKRFDTLDRGIQDLRERHELHAGEFRKINSRLDSMDGHLGINTDPQRARR